MKLDFVMNLRPASHSCHNTPVSAQNLPFQMQSIGYFEALKGYYTDRQGLESWLLMLTISGSGQLRYRGATMTLASGDLALVDCRQDHYYAAADEPWYFWWLHFIGDSTGEFDRRIQADAAQTVAVDELSGWLDDFRNLLSLADPQILFADLKTSQVIGKLLTQLVILRYTPRNARNAFLHQEKIARILDFIEQHSHEPISLADLTAQAYLSPFYFSRLFKAYTAKSPHEYLIHVRINRAKFLLASTSHNIAKIAEQTGFNDANHLIRQFRQACGVTPLVFRKQHRMG